jgi:ABC-type transport system involved in multi-copper enzyme maturation permease subunit
VVFVGAVSLFFSALCRRAHIAVTLSVLSLAFVFLVVPFLLNSPLVPSRRGTPTLAALNPYLLLLSRPNTPPGAPGTPMAGPILGIAGTIVCCVVLVLAARVLLAGATGLVSRVALPRAMGEPVLLDRLRRGRWRSGTKPHSPQAPRAGIRRVTGPPMIWKEMVCTLSGSQKFVSRMVIGVEAALVLLAYLFPALTAIVDYGFLHVVCVFAFFGLGVLLTIMSSATVISIEREARTWPLLLLTPLTDREILVGKVVGVLRRCGPAWLMLLAYIAAFAYGGCYRPLAVVQVTLLVLSVVLFLTATGFYFGSRFSRTSEAVTANLIFVGVLWCIPPLLDLAVPSGSRAFTLTMVPFSQAFAMIITTLVGSESRVRWFTGSVDAAGLVGVMFMSMMGYLVLSLAFAWMAVRRLRRRLP